MRLCSRLPAVKRAQPLLGTIVAIRVYDLPSAAAHRAITAAFAEIAATHRAMSFHEPDSEVSRLNREACWRPVAVSAHTRVVLRLAQCVAEATDGVFDITRASRWVAAGRLPRPESLFPPDPDASWRDVEMSRVGDVRFRRPLWIDLGGIAKGYAVDRAVICLSRHGVRRGCVNAGGDLRVLGTAAERIALRVGGRSAPASAVLELAEGSVASSARPSAGAVAGPADRPNQGSAGAGVFASVVAEDCAIADALTKPVLACGSDCTAALRRFGALAWLVDAAGNWDCLGAGT
jgi:thiamine biosynthesis lipoprotein